MGSPASAPPTAARPSRTAQSPRPVRTLTNMAGKVTWLLRHVASQTALQLALVALCLGSALAGGWFGRPTKGAPQPVAIQLAGNRDELGRVLGGAALAAALPSVLDAEPDCRAAPSRPLDCRWVANKAKQDVRRDFWLIGGYGLAGFVLCGFAAWRVGPSRRQRLLYTATWAAIGVALLDVAENVALLKALSDAGGAERLASAVAIAKWALVPVFLFGVLCALRTIWTCRTWPPPETDVSPATRDDAAPRADRPSDRLHGLDRSGRWQPPDDAQWDYGQRGICFSGGGIRSASFCLGALQRLQEQEGEDGRSALSEARYLSAVSGGGYLAGAFQLLVTKTKGQSTFRAGSAEEDHLRRHANYLADSAGEWGNALVQGVGKLLANLAMVAVLIWIVAQPLGWAGRLFLWTLWPSPAGPWPHVPESVGFALGGLSLVAVACGATRRRHRRADETQAGLWRARRSGFAASLALSLGAAAAVLTASALVLPFLGAAGFQLAHKLRLDHGFAAGSWPTALVAAVLTKVVNKAFKREAGGAGKATPTAPKKKLLPFADSLAELVAGPLLMVVGVGYLSFFAAHARTVGPNQILLHIGRVPLYLWAAAIGVAAAVFAFGRWTDAVDWSMHRFYKRRLWSALAYSPDRHGERDWGEGACLSVDGQRYDHTDPNGKALRFPELVLCGAAQVSGASLAPPGRRTVTWTFDSGWVGGPEIGWCRTADVEAVMKQRRKPEDVSLFGAIAISGAAFGSAMGRHSRGSLNSVFALANARLGVWLPNPRKLSEQRREREEQWPVEQPPNQMALNGTQTAPVEETRPGAVPAEIDLRGVLPNGHGPAREPADSVKPWPSDEHWDGGRRHLGYVAREVFGRYSPDDPWILVSDGGHYENLGLIELFRRRCTKILCFDASGASGGAPTTVAEALRLAEEELGVVVTIMTPWSSLPGQGPLPVTAERLADALDGRLAQSSVLIGSVLYPPEAGLEEDERQGWLVIGRSVMDADVPWTILSYASGNAEFPNDSTGDQWFDHDQFANYRLLGRHVADEVINIIRIRPRGWWDSTEPSAGPPDLGRVPAHVGRDEGRS
jgi:hypothetical protein